MLLCGKVRQYLHQLPRKECRNVSTQGVYRLAFHEIVACVLPAAGLGLLAWAVGFFWTQCGLNFTVLNLTSINTPLWAMVGGSYALVLAVLLKRVRIVVDNTGVTVHNTLGLFRLPSFRWDDVDTLAYEMQGKISSKRRMLAITLKSGFRFSLPADEHRQSLLPTGSDTAIDALITDASGRKPTALAASETRDTMELDKESGHLTYAALLVIGIGLSMLTRWRAHYLDSSLRPWIIMLIALAALGLAHYYQRRSLHRAAAGFVSVLFAVTVAAGCWVFGMSLPIMAGSTVPVTFRVISDDPTSQRLESVGHTPVLSISIKADHAHRQIRPGQSLQLIVNTGPLGLNSINQDEYTKLVLLD
jgi:hypothetical protein